MEMVNVYCWDMSIAFLAHVWMEMVTEADALSMHVYVSDSDVCFVSDIFIPCMQITYMYTDKNVLTAGAPYTALCHIL